MSDAILDIRNVNIKYVLDEREILACDQVSLQVYEQDSVGIVGESGSGKSTLAMGILGLLPVSITQIEGEAIFKGKNLINLSENEMSEIRWKDMSVVFQKSLNALSPVHRIGKQFEEIYRTHKPKATKEECRALASQLFKKVNMSDRVYDLYPHELSGGMMQRVAIALSMMFNPKLIILDEATTALDVVTESQILKEIVQLQETERITRIMITHNVSVVASTCKKIVVMYAGCIMESGLVEDVLVNPKHPYTKGLLNSFPSFKGDRGQLRGIAGSLPDLSRHMPGCVFAPRCPYADERCKNERPKNIAQSPGWFVACHRAERGVSNE